MITPHRIYERRQLRLLPRFFYIDVIDLWDRYLRPMIGGGRG